MNKSFSVFALFFFLCVAPLLQATVAPVILGEGIWNVLTRVAFAASEIEGATGCYYFITQTNIPLTITKPGNYCLDESIVFSGTAVTISSSDVNFDLNGYSMDANFATNSVAFLLNSGDNISITNGLIRNTKNGAILSSSTPHRNIVVSDLDIVQNLVGIVMNNGMNVESLLIENCYFANGGGINIQGSGITVRGCELDDSFTGTGVASITIQGLSDVQLARHVIVEDCSVTGSLVSDVTGISIQQAKNAIVNNCKVEGASGGSINGITFNDVSNLRCSNCLLANLGSSGIRVSTSFGLNEVPVDSARVENCVVTQAAGVGILVTAQSATISNVTVTDCAVSRCGSIGLRVVAGFSAMKNILIQRCNFLQNLAGVAVLSAFLFSDFPITNIVIKDCVCEGSSSAAGFSLQAPAGGATRTGIIVVTGCISQDNAGNGFEATAAGPAPVNSLIFDHCSAQRNNDGFHFSSAFTALGQVINCCTEANNAIGYFSLGGTNVFLANSSLGDKVTSFSGPPVALIKLGAVAASTATYWNNVGNF